MHRLVRDTLVLISILAGLVGIATAAEATRTWTVLDGRLSVQLPAEWRAIPDDERAAMVLGAYTPDACVMSPDRALGFSAFLMPNPTPDATPHDLQRNLEATLRQHGWAARDVGRALINGAAWVMAEGTREHDGRTVWNLFAVAPVGDRLVQIVFLASGPDREAAAMEARLALGTVMVDEAADADPEHPATPFAR